MPPQTLVFALADLSVWWCEIAEIRRAQRVAKETQVKQREKQREVKKAEAALRKVSDRQTDCVCM